MFFHHTSLTVLVICLICLPLTAQTAGNRHAVQQCISQNNAMLDHFSQKCERRTKKAEKRFARYERKMTKSDSQPETQKSNGLGKEPLLDSLRLVYGFAEYTGVSKNQKSITRAQQQLNVTQRTKSELMQRKEYWKAQVKEHPEYSKWLSKMEKERYYYSAQISEYRKVLRDPATLDDKLMNALRRDPRFRDFMATLPPKPQNPEKMQPRQLVQQMMQSQAAAIDSDPTKLIKDAKNKGSELLNGLSDQSFGNVDNAAQKPKFTPNPFPPQPIINHSPFRITARRPMSDVR